MVSDEEARAAAQEILSQRSFTRWHSDFETWLRSFEALVDSIPSGLIDALVWLYETLIEGLLLGFLRGLAGILKALGLFGDAPAAIGWLALILLFSVGFVFAYRVWGASWFEAPADPTRRRVGRTHAQAIREARALAAGGQYLAAAHRVQLASLALLIETERLNLGRADPNRTLRRRVEASTLPETERRKLIELVDRLESLWFDEPREDRELFDEWIALDARLHRAVGGAGA